MPLLSQNLMSSEMIYLPPAKHRMLTVHAIIFSPLHGSLSFSAFSSTFIILLDIAKMLPPL